MRTERVIIVKPYASPIGVLLLGSFEDRLCLCNWRTTAEHGRRMDERLQTRLSATYLEGTSEIIETAQSQLEEYFAGKRITFQMPLLLSGTDFQRSVWKELLQIPYGQTITYGEIARRIAVMKNTSHMSAQAVGGAVGHNEISIIIPCHRVVGTNGSLTGYAGGIDKKISLLKLEHTDMSRLFIPKKGTAL